VPLFLIMVAGSENASETESRNASANFFINSSLIYF
jgi:hypothetical protein